MSIYYKITVVVKGCIDTCNLRRRHRYCGGGHYSGHPGIDEGRVQVNSVASQ